MKEDGSYKDIMKNHHFLPTTKFEKFNEYTMESKPSNSRDVQFRSLPFRNDDCLISPSNCIDGLTIATSMKSKDVYVEKK